MAQLSFAWPQRPPSYERADFIRSAANEEAARFIDSWPDKGAGCALISGPEASGKTHLATIWAARVQAVFIATPALGKTDSATLFQHAKHAVLEDIHAVTDETALFHLLRHAETQGLCLLMTARPPASALPFTLADLCSRLRALPGAAIREPDEAALRGFLFKCFADRQLRVSPETADYLLKRTDRSFIAVRERVAALEKSALESGRHITIPLVKSLM